MGYITRTEVIFEKIRAPAASTIHIKKVVPIARPASSLVFFLKS